MSRMASPLPPPPARSTGSTRFQGPPAGRPAGKYPCQRGRVGRTDVGDVGEEAAGEGREGREGRDQVRRCGGGGRRRRRSRKSPQRARAGAEMRGRAGVVNDLRRGKGETGRGRSGCRRKRGVWGEGGGGYG